MNADHQTHKKTTTDLRKVPHAFGRQSGLGLILVALACTAAKGSGQDPYAPKPAMPDGFTLIGGDILVPAPFVRSRSPFSPNPGDYWPGGVVPYEFDANVTSANQG